MTVTESAPERRAVLEETVRRSDEQLETFAALEEHYVAEIARLEDEIAALREGVEGVSSSSSDGGALARHDLRQRIIDAQLTRERHVHELGLLQNEIAATKAAREEAVSELKTLRG
jgi:hypothetical protein